ncbi:MAG TPA: hypothetical protein VKA30_00435 [Actinomycetota bacterium]|nr:hypothetical protein [Actinomycetota bacterium]
MATPRSASRPITARKRYRLVSVRRVGLVALLTSLFALSVSTLPAWAAPANDTFPGTTISGATGTIDGTNALATGESGEPDNAGVSDPIQSVWYAWTAPAAGNATFDTCTNGTYDTTLGVYTGSAVNLLTSKGSNDDACGAYGPGLNSRVTFTATSGTTYYVSIDGNSSNQGTFTLSWSVHPANDDFANAQVLAGSSGSVNGSDAYATYEPGEPVGSGPVNSVWYSWTAPFDGAATFDACTADTYTLLWAYTGSAVNNLTLVNGNYNSCGPFGDQSVISIAATSGTTYYIREEGYESHTGTFTLSWNEAVQTDLSVVLYDDVDPVSVGQNLTYTLYVNNTGVLADPAASFGMKLSPKFTPVSGDISDPAWTCHYTRRTRQLVCQGGTLAALNGGVVLHLVVKAGNATGYATTYAKVQSSMTDYNSSNNTTAESTLIT